MGVHSNNDRFPRPVFPLVLPLALLMNCGGGDGSEPEQLAGDGAPILSALSLNDQLKVLDEPAPMAIGMKINTDVLKMLDDVKKQCAVNKETFTLERCKSNEIEFLAKWLRKERPSDVMLTLANAASSGDEKMQFVCRRVMNRLFSALSASTRKENASTESVGMYLRLLRHSRDQDALEMATIATHIATLGGQSALLDLVATAHPTKGVRARMLRSIMTYGGIDELDILKRASKDADGALLLDILVGLQRTSFRGELKAATCTWVEGFLSHSDPKLAAAAIITAARCGGRTADMILVQGQRHVRAGQFTKPFSTNFHTLCPNFSPSADKAMLKRCKRTFKFLESVLRNEKMDSEIRAEALQNIHKQRRDKHTVKLMRKYAKNKNRTVRETARRLLQELHTVYGFK